MFRLFEDGSGFIQTWFARIEWDAFDSAGDTIRIILGG